MYELAFQLGMPLYKLRREMPYEELSGWFYYFSQRPIGWREDNRTMLMLQSQGVKLKPEQVFASLAAIKKSSENAKGTIDEDGNLIMTKEGLQSSSLLSKLLGATGGDTLPILQEL